MGLLPYSKDSNSETDSKAETKPVGAGEERHHRQCPLRDMLPAAPLDIPRAIQIGQMATRVKAAPRASLDMLFPMEHLLLAPGACFAPRYGKGVNRPWVAPAQRRLPASARERTGLRSAAEIAADGHSTRGAAATGGGRRQWRERGGRSNEGRRADHGRLEGGGRGDCAARGILAETGTPTPRDANPISPAAMAGVPSGAATNKEEDLDDQDLDRHVVVPDEGADLPGYAITLADVALDGIYGDHPYANDG